MEVILVSLVLFGNHPRLGHLIPTTHLGIRIPATKLLATTTNETNTFLVFTLRIFPLVQVLYLWWIIYTIARFVRQNWHIHISTSPRPRTPFADDQRS